MKLVVGRDDLAAAALAAVRLSGTSGERVEVRPVHKASRGFVNDASVDVCEVAIVTLLQAAAYDKPVVLLPITTLGRFQHQTLVASKVDWTVYEGAHVDEYEDPKRVRRAPEDASLQQDFLDGRLDFGIMGSELPSDERIRTAIADAHDVAAQWTRDKGFSPVNHVVCVSETSAREHSAAICAAYDAMRAVLDAAPKPGPVDFEPTGFEVLRGPASQAAAFAYEQGVLPRPVEFDEVVARTCAALDVPPSRLGG